MRMFPKVFVWNPVSSPDPNDSPFKEQARRILYVCVCVCVCVLASDATTQADTL